MKISQLGKMGMIATTAILLSGCSGNDNSNLLGTKTTGIENGSMSGTMTGNISLSQIQIQQLQYLVEEEKLARDVYNSLNTQRNHRKFANIINSEENHQSLVQEILKNYGVQDPSIGRNIGEYGSQELGLLYLQLTQRGGISLSEAFGVGVTIEEMDIKDIETMLPLFAGYPDIQSVLQRLLEGSKKHLQAFNN